MTSDRVLNRELSWLAFNRRVLEAAQNPAVPLLERMKLLATFSSNLDGFFMVRVADLKRQIHGADHAIGADGMDVAETIAAVSATARELTALQHRIFLEGIQPLLAAEGVHILRPKEITEVQLHFLEEHFHRNLLPALTPLAIDPGRPFPYLGIRSLGVLVSIRRLIPSSLPSASLAVVHIPRHAAPPLVALPNHPGRHAFMLLEDVVRLYLPRLYRGYEILSSQAIRVTRTSELRPPRRRLGNEQSLHGRMVGAAVRLQYDADLPAPALSALLEELELQPEDLYAGQGFTTFSALVQLHSSLDLPRLKDHKHQDGHGGRLVHAGNGIGPRSYFGAFARQLP